MKQKRRQERKESQVLRQIRAWSPNQFLTGWAWQLCKTEFSEILPATYF